MVLGLWPNYVKTKVFDIFPVPEKKPTNKQTNENEAKINILKELQNESHHDNPLNLLYILATFYMSDIFSSLNILVQTQLGHYLHVYHPTLIFADTTFLLGTVVLPSPEINSNVLEEFMCKKCKCIQVIFEKIDTTIFSWLI